MNFLPVIIVSIFCVASATPPNWSRIIGGQLAEEGQFPHQVSIRNNGVHICGGSIINQQWVLTVAECILFVPTERLTVKAGSNQLSSGGQIYSVAEKTFHDGSGTSSSLNIALVKISETFLFNDKVQAVQLLRDEIGADVDLLASGWGKTSVSGQNVENLQFAHLKSISVDECQSTVNMDESQLCTLDEDKQHGICGGDFGGPLMYEGKLVGVTSYTVWCGAGYPDIFKRVSWYFDWINKTVN